MNDRVGDKFGGPMHRLILGRALAEMKVDLCSSPTDHSHVPRYD